MIAPILDFSVHQRWLVVLLTLACAGFGIRSLQMLPIDAVPDVTNRQVQVNSVAPALSPYEIERLVTYPVETALAGIPGLDTTRSLSRNGFSQVTAVFHDNVDVYFARQQVMERLAQARDTLPDGIEPQMTPVSTGLGEIYMWALDFLPRGQGAPVRDGRPGWQSDGSYLTPEGERLTTDLERGAYLRTLQDWIIRPQMRTVPGVAGVDSLGGHAKQYHVQPDPNRLVALGLGFEDIAAALERNNVSRGARYLERNGEGYVVRSAGRLESMAEIGEVVVATREGGVPVRVKDVAEVSIGRELRTGSASLNGHEVVVGTALMLVGGNSRTVAQAVGAKLKEISRSLPPGVQARTMLDRSGLVNATIYTVAKNLAEGAALVVAVLFLMLGNLRAAVITAMVIPVTMLLTVTGMVEAGISANLMSLGALDFGLIVDGAVIIAENSLRHLAERQRDEGRPLSLEERLQTVVTSAREMIRPSVFGQAIIILVYVPFLTLTGVEGRMFAPMALTVVIALGAAFVLSLTFVPAMVAIAVTGRVSETDNFLIRAAKQGYAPALRHAVRRPLLVVGAAAALFAGSVLLAGQLGQDFMPQLDEGDIVVAAVRIPSTSLSQSQEMQLGMERAILRLPEVSHVFSKAGTADLGADPMPPNAADAYVMLKPRAEWPDPSLPKDELIRRVEAAIARLPGNGPEFSQPIQMRFNELLAGVRGDVAVKVFGDEFGPMLRTANQIAAVLGSIPGAEDVKVEQAAGLPFLEITVDKAEIARRGLTVAAVQDVIGAAIGGREAGFILEGDRRFPIVVRLPDAVRDDLEALRNLPVPLPRAERPGSERASAMPQSVPLRSLASFRFTEGPNQVSRENGKRRVVVTANVRGRDIASLAAEAQARVEREVRVPPGYWLTWGGQFENLTAARARLMVVVPGCFFLIFLLLYTALGSPRDALLVFSAVPLALTGGIVALWLRDMPLSVTAVVGFVALSGVAVLNGLVMLTHVKQLVAEGLPQREAILRGAIDRLRPVIMTALVASLGFVPMAVATGAGAEVQKPLATVVIGGLITATLLTLLVLPALYARFGSAVTVPATLPNAPNLAAHPAAE
ncbi:efflux RND transporter permease subunit [Roseicella aerolata]|uniref:CusA/CzcA family heavy metal efflux RND transporter n=1 Tax=Roseicella aerolata TaxID=2883479 RepID=A0A9X1IHA9_9PROT|nr:CusA/CzcA family heavy metal efflux RND transporter [Roseicella aerolata]MCB4824550.1 CusA/CzcA family heavy metal efflux RND transporter [Roseicella aerolata]